MLRGRKVILYFYGEAGTPACTAQACDFEESLGTLENAGYSVVGVSRDETAPIEKMAADKVRCEACPVLCQISPGKLGACDRYGNVVRERSSGILDDDHLIAVIAIAFQNLRGERHGFGGFKSGSAQFN